MAPNKLCMLQKQIAPWPQSETGCVLCYLLQRDGAVSLVQLFIESLEERCGFGPFHASVNSYPLSYHFFL